MQIDIESALNLTDECRAYVEYRIFSAASRFEGIGARVQVLLQDADRSARAAVRCVATMTVEEGRRVRVSASASRVQAAVDRAAQRLSDRLERQFVGRTSAAERPEGHGPEVPSPPKEVER